MSQRSLDMNRLHFSLWAITSAPLILGMHPESMTDELIAVVTNKEAIAINQLYAGSAGDIIVSHNASHFHKNYHVAAAAAELPSRDHAKLVDCAKGCAHAKASCQWKMTPVDSSSATSPVYIHGGDEKEKNHYWNVQMCDAPIILQGKDGQGGCADGTNELFTFDPAAGTLVSAMKNAVGKPVGILPAPNADMALGLQEKNIEKNEWSYDATSLQLRVNGTMCVASAHVGPSPSPPPVVDPIQVWCKPLPLPDRSSSSSRNDSSTAALALVNIGTLNATISVEYADLPPAMFRPGVVKCTVHDVWEGTTRTGVESPLVYENVRSRQAILLRLTDCR